MCIRRAHVTEFWRSDNMGCSEELASPFPSAWKPEAGEITSKAVNGYTFVRLTDAQRKRNTGQLKGHVPRGL